MNAPVLKGFDCCHRQKYRTRAATFVNARLDTKIPAPLGSISVKANNRVAVLRRKGLAHSPARGVSAAFQARPVVSLSSGL